MKDGSQEYFQAIGSARTALTECVDSILATAPPGTDPDAAMMMLFYEMFAAYVENHDMITKEQLHVSLSGAYKMGCEAIDEYYRKVAN